LAGYKLPIFADVFAIGFGLALTGVDSKVGLSALAQLTNIATQDANPPTKRA
jgi:hypothetical protein